MKRKALAIILVLLIPWGCGPNYSQHTYLKIEHLAKQRIAVLPFANQTVDFDASPVFRYAVHNFLRYKGYSLLSNAEVDTLLQEEGISEGGQLEAFTPQELGAVLGADLLLFGTITEFNTKYALVYSSITVEGEFKLVETKRGQKVWESTSGSYSNNFSRIFFVGDLLDLLLTLDVKEFITNNDFVKLFEDDYEHILSESYLRQNVGVASPAGESAKMQISVDPEAARAIMQGASAGVRSITQNLRGEKAVVVILIVFLTWTLLYAIFDNYNNYVVETVVKGFGGFPGLTG